MDKKIEEQINKLKKEIEHLNTYHRVEAERCLKSLNLIKDIKERMKND